MKSLLKLFSLIVLTLFSLLFTNCIKEVLQEEEISTSTEPIIVNPYTQRVVKLTDIQMFDNI